MQHARTDEPSTDIEMLTCSSQHRCWSSFSPMMATPMSPPITPPTMHRPMHHQRHPAMEDIAH